MSETLKIIIGIAGIVIGTYGIWILTTSIIDKIQNKRRFHDFSIMCYAVAADICLTTKCNYTELLEVLERCLEINSSGKAPEGYVTQDYDIAYTNKDYLNFTHLVALKYAAENDMHEDIKTAINEFCGKKYLTDRNILGCSTLDHISDYTEGKYRYYSKLDTINGFEYGGIAAAAWFVVFGLIGGFVLKLFD